MPRLTVRLHGGLECHATVRTPAVVDLPAGATLLDLQDRLGIRRGEVALFLLDGELQNEAAVPDADGTVDLYPMFGGG